MALARARALRAFQSGLRHSGRGAVPRIAAPSRTQLIQRRYASDSGGHADPGSDLPWALGAVIVTIPSCYYLWPDSSHADAGHHDAHGEHEEQSEESEGKEEEAPQEEESKEEEPKEKELEGHTEEDKKEDKKFEKEEAEKQDKDYTKAPGDAQDSMPPGGDAESKGESSESESESSEGKSDSSEGSDESSSEESTEESQSSEESGEAVDTQQKPRSVKKYEGSGRQLGNDSTNAKHTREIDTDPTKSKKGEGTPETARLTKTVDPSRPAK